MAPAAGERRALHEAAVADVAGDVTGSRVRDVRELVGGISNSTYLVRPPSHALSSCESSATVTAPGPSGRR
jgi:hypothetical protein